MRIIVQVVAFISLSILFGSCSNYQKTVRNDDYDAKFEQANLMYNKKSYVKAITLYEQVYQRFPQTEKGRIAYYRLAKSFFAEKDFYMAGYYFNQYAIRFPTDENAEEALFLAAICSVKNSPGTFFDQEETELALNDLQLFAQRYPESELIDSCNRIMDRLRLKIETKRFYAVKLYDRMGESRAVVTSSQSFLGDYPRSTYFKEATIIQFENAYKLAMNSILNKKKERIEDALSILSKYRTSFETKKSYADKTNKYEENLNKELLKVEEQYDYIDIVRAFENSNSSSKQKKVSYLEETIARFNNFAKKYPDSNLIEKARNYHKKAERELSNI